MEKLSEKEWKEFTLETIFSVGAGKRLTNADKIDGDRPFVGATDNNNGVTGFVGNVNASLDQNVLGVNYNGAPCIAFYHPYRCLFTDDVKRLHLRNHTDDERILLFMKGIVMQQRAKYSYGYKFKEKRMLRQKLMLPVTDSGDPDYEYIGEYIQRIHEKKIAEYRAYVEKRIAEIGAEIEIPKLSEKEWSKFRAFGDKGILDIATTNSSIDGIRLIDGAGENLPYITRSEANNGIARFVSGDNRKYGIDPAGSITIGLDTQTAYWQPHEFVTGQNIQVITGNVLNEWNSQFLIPLLRKQMKAKFNWGGNGATLKRMKMLDLMLPVTDSGKPDYEYMEQYAKNMMLRKYKQYLAYLDKER